MKKLTIKIFNTLFMVSILLGQSINENNVSSLPIPTLFPG